MSIMDSIEERYEERIAALTTERDRLDGDLTAMSKTAWEQNQRIADLLTERDRLKEALSAVAEYTESGGANFATEEAMIRFAKAELKEAKDGQE